MAERGVADRGAGLSWSGWLVVAGLGLAVGLAFLDPGPSRGLGWPLRLAFWLAHVLLPIALLAGVQAGMGRLSVLDAVSPWLRVALAGAAGAVLFAPVALALDGVLPLPAGMADGGPWWRELGGEVLALAPPMMLAWLGINAPRLLRFDPVAPRPAEPEPPEEAAHACAFWERVPPRLGRDLVSVSAELHYLRIVTVAGDALVLHSFGRALPCLEALPGLRIHRSHWVARAHVVAVERAGERVSVRLSSGARLPVSRAYRAALRAAMEA